MPKKTLVIDSVDRDRFFLSVNDGTLQVGDVPGHAEGTLHGLRVTRIRCEIEVDDDAAVAVVDAPGAEGGSCEIRAGEVLQLLDHLSLTVVDDASVRATETMPILIEPPPEEPPKPTLARFLRVVDGADKGRTFPLPLSGSVTVGKSAKYSDIVLHDLFVARVHCKFEIVDDDVVVSNQEGDAGTLVDGTKIDSPTLVTLESVIRVGNTHLRMELAAAIPIEEEVEASEDVGFEVLEPAVSLPPPPSSRRIAKPDDPLVGQVFGHFHIDEFAGRGLLGKVFRATDTKTNQPVTLNVYAPEFPATPKELERFTGALKAISPVHHANLVALAGMGRTGAHCWLAREFVEGESAAAIVERVAGGAKPNWPQVLRLGVHLARALTCLHQHHLVHANITPWNVQIRTADQVVKLTDLGVVKAFLGSQLLKSVWQQKLQADLAYLAPEQTQEGSVHDEPEDLYAVGGVMYAMLTGQPPYHGDTPQEILDNVQLGELVNPSVYHKKIPAQVEAVVLKLLAPSPKERYRTPAALLADLKPVAASFGVDL